ncbi:MAG: hypothetical protein CMJ64_08560 [Planctomycetaceae bacterium]|nr:hypothetical protein [Planctomycetaceae bacterium]
MSEAIDNTQLEPSNVATNRRSQAGSLLLKLPQQILSVTRFEFRRTNTLPRLAVWAGLMVFPMVIAALVSSYGGATRPYGWGFMLYILVPHVTCHLGLLLWVAPNVNNELEGRTWFYLTARPGGRIALLLGKHINGLLWTVTAGWIAASLAVLVAGPTLEDHVRHWWALLLTVTLATLAYGSLFTMVATLLPRRAMMICVAYVLIGEVFLGNMPAVINELTVHHHLANIFADCLKWPVDADIRLTLDTTPLWIHLSALGGYTATLLVVAAIILCWREYITSD